MTTTHDIALRLLVDAGRALAAIPAPEADEPSSDYGHRLRVLLRDQTTAVQLAGAALCAANDMPAEMIDTEIGDKPAPFDRADYQKRLMRNRREASKAAG